MKRLSTLTALALVARHRRRAGAIHRRRHPHRRDERHVGHLFRPLRPGLGRRRAHGGRGFRRRQEGHEGRDRRRRPPEQAGRGLERGAHLARRRPRRRRGRRADLVGGARREPDRAREEQGVPGLGRGRLRSHRRGLHAQHHPLDLRHLGARQRHRPGDREDRRQHLVLPHRQLRLRPRARARHRGGGGEERRQGARPGAPPLPRHRLLVVPAAGANVDAPRSSASPMPAATPSTRSSRRPSSASSRAARTSPRCSPSSPTCMRSACRPRRA